MPRQRSRMSFFCNECGAESPKWAGSCPACGHWNTMVEAPAAGPATSGARSWLSSAEAAPQELATLVPAARSRLPVHIGEVDRVLGGGIVPGSLVLVGGDPGIGKSTLLLQVAASAVEALGPVLYVSGEESAQQIRLRAERLGISGKGLYLCAETSLEAVLRHMDAMKPALGVVDSIQTVWAEDVAGAAGSVAQVRECALRLMQWAKARGTPVFITGHVTKEGAIAGPRVLEHMVDAVLYLEGESFGAYRILRGVKNRFGSTNEVGVFEMTDRGMREVANPSLAFLSPHAAPAPGVAIVPTLEGTRPLLAEVQALTSPSQFGTPRRTANGVDLNRLHLMTAVLGRRLRVPLGNQDVIVNVVGGLRIDEPAADLGIALAIVSSFRNVPVRDKMVVVGEVGLSGELRPVSQTDRRLAEAASLGFRVCLLSSAAMPAAPPEGLELLPAATLREAVRLAMPLAAKAEAEPEDDLVFEDKS
ncbi:MAG: DNA repair protein RadA [Chloroflexota bacterium]